MKWIISLFILAMVVLTEPACKKNSEPAPQLVLLSTPVSLVMPQNCQVAFYIANTGPKGSVLNFNITGDDHGGALNYTPANGQVQAGKNEPVYVTATSYYVNNNIYWDMNVNLEVNFPQILIDHKVANVGGAGYTEYMDHTAQVPVNFYSINDMADSITGTWSGTWSGTSYANMQTPAGKSNASVSVNGTWTLNMQNVNVQSNTASGTLTWDGTDAYWVGDDQGNNVYTNIHSVPFIPNRTISFDGSNSTCMSYNCGTEFNFQININAPNPSDAFYGPALHLNLRTNGTIDSASSWLAHPYDPNTSNTFISQGPIITGSKN